MDTEDTVIVWSKEEVQDAIAEDLNKYIQQKINDYNEINLSGTELYNKWKADFINFTEAAFAKNRESLKILRDYLW